MNMKGEDRVYVIALLFTFILGIGSFVIMYSDVSQNKNYRNLNSLLGLPDEFVEKLSVSDNLVGSMRLVSWIDEDGTKGFILENNGELPLTGFTIEIGDAKYEPYAAPSMLIPGEKAAIIVDSVTWQRIFEARGANIMTKQGVKVSILIG